MQELLALTNLLLLVMAAHLAWALHRASPDGLSMGVLAGATGAYAAWAMAWAWHPWLADWRRAEPIVQPVLVLSGIALLASTQALPAVRHHFATARLEPLAVVFVWRAVFGALLLVLGHQGRLPQAFTQPVGLGDVLVGAWALALCVRLRWPGRTPGIRELRTWNLLGLLDLLNAMRLAATVLPPWLADRPEEPGLPLLALLGVPLFVALHLHLWRTLARH